EKENIVALTCFLAVHPEEQRNHDPIVDPRTRSTPTRLNFPSSMNRLTVGYHTKKKNIEFLALPSADCYLRSLPRPWITHPPPQPFVYMLSGSAVNLGYCFLCCLLWMQDCRHLNDLSRVQGYVRSPDPPPTPHNP
ncbi:hypothetical protein OTU49_001366, partial [Cherax quadricarinatus]